MNHRIRLMRPNAPAMDKKAQEMDTGKIDAAEEEALQFHAKGAVRAQKLSDRLTKPLDNLAARPARWPDSPGVASPPARIQRDPGTAYDYTSKGNFVAVISNGTAVVGLRRSRRPGRQAGDGSARRRCSSALPISTRSTSKSTRGMSTSLSIAVRFLHAVVRVASTSKHASARPNVSSSRSGCANCSTSRCFMTTSTARRSSPPPG